MPLAAPVSIAKSKASNYLRVPPLPVALQCLRRLSWRGKRESMLAGTIGYTLAAVTVGAALVLTMEARTLAVKPPYRQGQLWHVHLYGLTASIVECAGAQLLHLSYRRHARDHPMPHA